MCDKVSKKVTFLANLGSKKVQLCIDDGFSKLKNVSKLTLDCKDVALKIKIMI